MPHPKIKSENYTNFGGVNSKLSPYSTGAHEFLDLTNLDFQTPGSLSTRWGSSQYIGQTFAGPIKGLYEYEQLTGSSYLVISHSGSIWFGASTGNQIGISLTQTGVTTVFTPKIPLFAFSAGNGFIEFASISVPYQGDIAQQFESGNATFVIAAQTHSENQLDFVTFQNNLFGADGNKFFKFNGLTATFVGLPPGQGAGGVSAFVADASNPALPQGNDYAFMASYVNNRGFEGEAWPVAIIRWSGNGASLNSQFGASSPAVSMRINTPLAYGISSINLYAYSGTSITNNATLWNYPFKFLRNVAASGSTVTTVTLGASSSLFNIGANPPGTSYTPLGFTFTPIGASATGFTYGFFQITNFAPRYLELHNNRLFLAGFSTQPSSVYFSDVGEPEGYDIASNFEVRTNDGDRLYAMKSYNSRLYMFKYRSFYALTGDRPENFSVDEISIEYGCGSNRAVTVYNDLMVFLDLGKKALMQYNGANIECLSDRFQPVFDRINSAAAIDNATIVNDRTRNQLLLGVPVDGATQNNLTLVYDYLVPGGAWTKYEGYNPALFAVMQGRLSNKTVFYGDYSGRLNNFGASFIGDNGSGFTGLWQTRFVNNGQSVEQQWRRHWLNVDPVPSATIPITINFLQDYGSSIVLSRTMYANPFQSRIDFGIPAKALSVLGSFNSATTAIKIHGYALGYRYQRDV